MLIICSFRQSFSEHDRKLLASWIVCEQSGKELSAHCDCVAGLGKRYSQVA